MALPFTIKIYVLRQKIPSATVLYNESKHTKNLAAVSESVSAETPPKTQKFGIPTEVSERTKT
jgi:hypothetical protein